MFRLRAMNQLAPDSPLGRSGELTAEDNQQARSLSGLPRSYGAVGAISKSFSVVSNARSTSTGNDDLVLERSHCSVVDPNTVSE
jgi:hypothetical protein